MFPSMCKERKRACLKYSSNDKLILGQEPMVMVPVQYDTSNGTVHNTYVRKDIRLSYQQYGTVTVP